MSEKAKKEFLDAFDAKSEGTLVGFCVMGGSFSEGIDLRGERLIGAIIVGVGLPTISSELNIIKEYFDKTRENGYAYAYTYPGMNKVLQAELSPIRERRARYEKDIPGVFAMLEEGSRKAEKKAAQTLAEMKHAMQIDYFQDKNLIAQLTQKYTV